MTQSTESNRGGCLLKIFIGCGALVLLVVLLAVGGCLWMAGTGEQIDTGQITGAESLGSAELGDMIEDEGLQQLLETVIRELDEQDSKNLPAWFPRQQRSVGDFGMFLPKSITFTLEDLPGHEDPALVAAVNFRGWVRPVKFAIEHMTNDDDEVRTYRDHRILGFGTRAFATFHQGTLLVANDLQAIQLIIDRLIDGSPSEARPIPESALPAGDWDATGGMRNDNGRLDDLLAGLDDPGADKVDAGGPQLGEDATLGFGFDVVNADLARGRAQLLVGESTDLAQAADLLQRLVDRFGDKFEDWELLVEKDVQIEDGRAVATIEVSGLQDAILRIFDELDSFSIELDEIDQETAPAPVEGTPTSTDPSAGI